MSDAEAEAQTLWPPDSKSQLIGKDHDVEKTEGRRMRGQWRMRWLNDISELIDMSLSKLKEPVKDRETWFAVVHWVGYTI